MRLLQKLIEPVLQAENANILCKDGGLRLSQNVAFLCVVDHLIFTMSVHPVAGTLGNKETRQASQYHNENQRCAQMGKDRQVHKKPAHIFQQVRKPLPNVFGRGAVVGAVVVRLFPQLDIRCVNGIHERGGVRLFRDHSDDRRPHIDLRMGRAGREIFLKPKRYEQRRRK